MSSRDKAYHDNEMKRFYTQVKEIDTLPRADKAENKARLLECWTTYPEIFAERIGWLLNGTYGYGAMIKALQIADNHRMNRTAGLSHLAACLEWSTNQAAAVAAWKTLTTTQQAKLDELIAAELKHFDENRDDYEPSEG